MYKRFFFQSLDQVWLLGRDKDFTVEVRQKIYNSLTQLGLDPERLILSKNKDCPSTL
jgi:apolipoprotein D and lipocalin family protein